MAWEMVIVDKQRKELEMRRVAILSMLGVGALVYGCCCVERANAPKSDAGDARAPSVASEKKVSYDFTRQRLFPGFDGRLCKIQPTIAFDGKGTALLAFQRLLLSGSDVFYGQFM